MSDQAFMELIPLTPFRKRFVDAGGRPLAKEPLYWTDYGLAGYPVVGMLVQRALAARGLLTEKKEP